MTPPVACGSAAVRPQLIGHTREALLEHLTSTRRIVASSAEYAASSTAYPAIVAIIEA